MSEGNLLGVVTQHWYVLKLCGGIHLQVPFGLYLVSTYCLSKYFIISIWFLVIKLWVIFHFQFILGTFSESSLFAQPCISSWNGEVSKRMLFTITRALYVWFANCTGVRLVWRTREAVRTTCIACELVTTEWC